MSAKGMGDIDELLAELTGEKTKKPASTSAEIDSILKSFGKNGSLAKEAGEQKNSFEPKTVHSLEGTTANKAENASFDKKPQARVINEDKPANTKAKAADSLFDSFFSIANNDDVMQPGYKKPSAFNDNEADTAGNNIKPEMAEPERRVSGKKASSKFSDDMFSEIFSSSQPPVTKAENKKSAKKELFEDEAYTESKFVREPQIKKPADNKAALSEPSVRRLEYAPQAGSLRSKILSAARSAAFATEEDEEYPAVPPKESAEPKEQAVDENPILKAYAEFAESGNGSGESQSGTGPDKEPSVSSEDEVPTVEFPVQGGKAVKQKQPVVMRPEGEVPSSAYSTTRRTSNILMSEVDDTFREFFGETVAVSRSDIEEGLRAKGKGKGKIFGKLFAQSAEEPADDQSEEDEEFDDEREETDDYNTPSDAPGVESALVSMRSTATLRVAATALAGVLLLYLGLSARTGLLPAIPVLDPANEPMLFLIANIALLLISGVVCISTIAGGFASVVKEPSSDILTSVCFAGAFLQGVAFLIKPDLFDPVKTTLFAPVAAVALCASAIGKRMQCSTVCRNFETVSVGYDHSAAYLLKNREVAAKVCRELEDDEPALLVSRPTALVKGFLKQSFSQCGHAKIARILSFVILGVSVIAFIFTAVQTKSFFSGLSAFAAVCCLCAPFSAALLQAVPASLMQKSTARVGAIVPGWSAIEALGTANAVLVNAKDLFPRECIRLHGIKTFEKERIDLAILYAASILVEGCDTLRDIFLGVIENKTEMLYKVDSLSVEPGLGFTAWVEHTRVIVGNRLIMQKHDISLPSLDYEMKYTKGERSPIYLAVSGKLFGMFLVSYTPSEEADEVLYSLTHSGVSIVVKSDDFNLTSDMLSQLYGIKRSQINVLNAAERDALSPLTAYLPESEGILTHLGTLTSFAGGLRAAAAAQGGLKLAGIVQIAAVALGVLLCVLLLMSKSLVSISLTAVLLFQLAWTALTVIVPFIKRY